MYCVWYLQDSVVIGGHYLANETITTSLTSAYEQGQLESHLAMGYSCDDLMIALSGRILLDQLVQHEFVYHIVPGHPMASSGPPAQIGNNTLISDVLVWVLTADVIFNRKHQTAKAQLLRVEAMHAHYVHLAQSLLKFYGEHMIDGDVLFRAICRTLTAIFGRVKAKELYNQRIKPFVHKALDFDE